MARFSIKLLGSMQFMQDGSPLQGLESAKVRALLAYLAVENGQPHTRERLAGLFWPELPEAQARHSLSQSLHNLRKALGETYKTGDLSGQPGSAAPFLLATPYTVQFNPLSDHALDVRQFEQAISDVHHHQHRRLENCGQCARLLRVAEQLYQHDFLTGVSLHGCQVFEEWALVRRERLHRQMCELLSDLSRYYEGRDELRKALEATERWAQMDPLNESAHRGWMRLLALAGQRTQVLARYTAFHKKLVVELGVEPARETQQLYRRILAEETAETNLPGMPERLPVPLTPFVGREDEQTELAAWLRDRQTRLVTVLGPGGSGKTRLALQVAHALRYDFPDGIFLVSLSGLASSEAFLPALANTLGVTFQRDWGDPFGQLLNYLRNRRMLLILDSFEEIQNASPWVTRLLESAAGVQVLVTSRARLNVHAEQVFPLEGLDYPDPSSPAIATIELADYAALQLFHNTASRVRPDHPHAPENVPHLARICQLVAGMPLGIMLAASWMSAYTPEDIAGEMERSLDFLSSSYHDLPERQRSLRATLDHSWQLLTAEERQAFQKLSVFQGTFTSQAARQVAQVDANMLRTLVDKSMLQTSAGSYRMHDLLRLYGAEKLVSDQAASSQVRDAHSQYYLERLGGYEPRLKSARRSVTLGEMDAEINDLQAAWKWACHQADVPKLGDGLPGLCLYYEMRVRYREGEQACQFGLDALPTAADQTSAAAVLYARLLLWRAAFLTLSGELEAARDLRQQAGELLDRLEAQGADARRPRAMYWQVEGETKAELKAKLDCYQRGIALYRELGDSWRQAGLLVWAGEYAMRLGDPSQALSYQQEALRLARQLSEPGILLHCLRQSTGLYLLLNQPDTALQLMQEVTAVCEQVDELPLRANAQVYLGQHLNLCGRFTEAIQILEQSVPVLRSLGYRYGMAYGEYALGLAYVMNGEYEHGEATLRSAHQIAEQGGFLREQVVALHTLGMATVAQGNLAQAADYFSQAVQRYRSMQFAGELAMSLGGLAHAQAAAGQLDSARDSLREALPLAEKTRSMAAMYYCLPASVYLLARLGHMEMALIAHRLVQKVPFLRNSCWYADVIGNEMETHWQALSPEKQAALHARVKGHTPFSIIPHVLALLEAG